MSDGREIFRVGNGATVALLVFLATVLLVLFIAGGGKISPRTEHSPHATPTVSATRSRR